MCFATKLVHEFFEQAVKLILDQKCHQFSHTCICFVCTTGASFAGCRNSALLKIVYKKSLFSYCLREKNLLVERA